VKIKQEHLDAIASHGKTGYPYEVCGLLLGRYGDGRVARIVQMFNREREKPRVRYHLDADDMLLIGRRYRDDGLEIVGYYHTHPDHPPRPSETDLNRAMETGGLTDGSFHIVMSIEGGTRASAPCGWIFRFDAGRFDEEPFEIYE
jgi:proteasome lid subunit RPN8/RPN11